ncbi:MAG TPA: hypothetical protein VMU04_25725 [Candidatus Acidoferrum sp.]|nr:hypothetical protein [Candidatus Acidoferrum sp.]
MRVEERRAKIKGAEHPTTNIQHPTSNIQHPTSNIQHPTSNIQHPTSNGRCREGQRAKAEGTGTSNSH